MRYLTVSLLNLVLLISFSVSAQSDSLKDALGRLKRDTTSAPSGSQPTEGKVMVIADSSIVHLERNSRGFKETKGYRIQLLLSSIDQIKQERNKYLSLGLPYPAYIKQVVPEYSLQIGDFPTRLEVEKHLQNIRSHYPKAFVVVESIEPPKYNYPRKP